MYLSLMIVKACKS